MLAMCLIFVPAARKRRNWKAIQTFRVHRWVVEVAHSFFNRFRKLLVCYEKKAANYLALVQFAYAVIV